MSAAEFFLFAVCAFAGALWLHHDCDQSGPSRYLFLLLMAVGGFLTGLGINEILT